jgi:hypothetical protein
MIAGYETFDDSLIQKDKDGVKSLSDKGESLRTYDAFVFGDSSKVLADLEVTLAKAYEDALSRIVTAAASMEKPLPVAVEKRMRAGIPVVAKAHALDAFSTRIQGAIFLADQIAAGVLPAVEQAVTVTETNDMGNI